MADYRDNYEKIRANGADVTAVSVDPAEKSQAVRGELNLPFPILCDTERRVVKDWDIYNSRERGGIAKPAVFVIDPSRMVRFASVDGVGRRVPALEIVRVLETTSTEQAAQRKLGVPSLAEFSRAIRNNFRR